MKFRNLKGVLALVLAIMVFASMSVAFAADPVTHTVTITVPTGHTYEIFQVFTGDYDAASGKLVSLKYGSNTSRTKTEGGETVKATGDAVSQTDMNTLTTLGSAQDVVGTAGQTLIDTLEGFVDFTSSPAKTFQSGTASDALAEGYYVIRDKMANLPEAEGATLYMFKVLSDDLSIQAKSDKPTSDKTVADINDSTGSAATQDNNTVTADYEIGDHVPYTLTATLPSDYANYEHYYLKFYDDMSKGLTYDTGSAKIKYGTADAIALDDPVAGTTTYEDGHMWTWEIIDLKAAAYASYNLTAGSVITITYTATLNGDAEVGLPGNPNKHYIEFSNNPNNTGDGSSKPGDTGKTPVDITFVLTYETIFNKVDQDSNPLTGADFELLKFVKNADGADEYDGEKGTWTNVTALGQEDIHPTKTKSAKDGIADSVFSFKGIDDGVYKLHETAIPTGYNGIADIIFTVTADHKVVSEAATLSLSGTDTAAENKLTFTPDDTAGTLSADVVNKSGIVLPSTGGIGTTIFYVAGSILVLAAAILLITKRRMGAND